MTTELEPSSDIIELRRRIITEQIPGAVLAELTIPGGLRDLKEIFDMDRCIVSARMYAVEVAEAVGNARTNNERAPLIVLFKTLVSRPYEGLNADGIMHRRFVQDVLDRLGVKYPKETPEDNYEAENYFSRNKKVAINNIVGFMNSLMIDIAYSGDKGYIFNMPYTDVIYMRPKEEPEATSATGQTPENLDETSETGKDPAAGQRA